MLPVVITGIILAVFVLARMFAGFAPLPPDLELGTAATIGNREVQADQFDYSYTDAGFMLCIADGIGRGEKGKIASSVAVDTCKTQFEQTPHFDNPGFFFRKAFLTANHDILEIIDDATAGANLLCVVISENQLYYALCGNCILCVYRKGDLVPLSEGHTIDVLAKQEFRKGRISRHDALSALHERRTYNYVGQDGFRNIEFYDTPVALQPGDIVVLATDGVREIYGGNKLEQLLKNSRMSCEQMAYTITDTVAAAEIKGDKDNAAVMLLRVNEC